MLVLSSLLLPAVANARFDGEKVIIGTGSMTGLYYPIGGALCRFLSKDYNTAQRVVCTVASTTGGLYNLNSMRNKDMDIGITQSDWEYGAYNSIGVFQNMAPMKNLRLIASMHKEYLSVLARKDANIKTIDDLKGKRVNIGAPGTGVRGAMKNLMKVKGWNENDFSVVSELKASEQAQALCDNKIDVMTDFIGHPNASMQEATVACDAVLIPIDDITAKQLRTKYPYYGEGIIPGNLYRENPNSVRTISVHSAILTTTSLSNEVAYKLAKSIVMNFEKIRLLSGALHNITREGLVMVTAAPIHEGARRYYEEIGILKSKINADTGH